jgi:hypothetical protein
MKKVLVSVALVLSLLLSGCGAEGPGYSNDVGDDTSEIPNSTYYIKQVNVGQTNCVIFRDGNMGGITCDWSNSAIN